MKSTYIGTNLEKEDFRFLGIVAAEKETSKSAILRSLAQEFLRKERIKKGEVSTRKGVGK
jgi:hypothetical protein